MKVITIPVLFLWSCYGFLLAVILIDLAREKMLREIPVLTAYLAFSVVRTGLLFTGALIYPAASYWGCYWMLQGVGYMLSALVGLSLIRTITKDPRWLIDLQAVACLVVALPFISCLWQQSWHPWMAVARWCDLAIIALVAWGLFHVEHWDPVNEGLAWGLAAGVAGHVACSLVQGDQNPTEWLRWLYQLAGIMQLSIWAWTLSRPKSPQIVELLAI